MFKRTFPTIIAMFFGFWVLLGTLIPVGPLVDIRSILIYWATILAAFALIVAYFALLRVHWLRITRGSKQKITSFLVIVSAIGSLMLVLWQGPTGEWPRFMVHHLLIPGEAALVALTAVTLILAGMRMLKVRRSMGSFIFIGITLLMLFVVVPYAYPAILQSLTQFVNVLATAGMRGILMGVALGTTLTGLRILLGIDRPHSDE